MENITCVSKEWRFEIYDTATSNNYWCDHDHDYHNIKSCINDKENDKIIDMIMKPLCIGHIMKKQTKTEVYEDYKKLANRCIELNIDPFKVFRGDKYSMFLNFWLYNYRIDLLPNIIKLIDDNKII